MDADASGVWVVNAVGVANAAVVVTGTGDVTGLLAACAALDPGGVVHRWSPQESAQPDPDAVAGGILVLDPGSAVGTEECAAFLALRARFGTAALVCTNIEMFWEWPRVLRTHRARLDPGADYPVFAVSTAAALAGAADESGMGDLVTWMRDACRATPAVRSERTRIGIALATIDQRTIARGDRDPGSGVDVLLARRQRLVAERERGRSDRLTAARAGLTAIRSSAVAEVNAGMRQLSAANASRTGHIESAGLTEHADWLANQIRGVAARVDRDLGLRLEELTDKTLLGIDRTDPIAQRSAQPGPPHTLADDVAVATQRHLPGHRRGAEDALLVLLGASTGLGIGRLAVAPMAAVHTLQWISMPVTLLLGIVVAVWLIRARRGTARRADLRQWGSEVLTEARGRLEYHLGQRIAEAETRLAGQIGRYHDRRTRQVAEELGQIDEQIRHRPSRPASVLSDAIINERAALVRRLNDLWADGGAGQQRVPGPPPGERSAHGEEGVDGSVRSG